MFTLGLSMKYIATLLLFIFLSGCGVESSSDVKNAKGDTPVKYIICAPTGLDCLVSARFDNLDSCQSHKEWADMLCDKTSSLGQMTCKENTHKIAVAYCTL
jgi:hypothetical protein